MNDIETLAENVQNFSGALEDAIDIAGKAYLLSHSGERYPVWVHELADADLIYADRAVKAAQAWLDAQPEWLSNHRIGK